MWSVLIVSFFVSTACGVPVAQRNHKMLPVFPAGKVVGGSGTDISQVPYQLQLEDSGFQFCGASIISARFALTAAHCTDGRSPMGLSVRSGSSYHATGGSVTPVMMIYQHPLYSSQTTDYDVSVLALDASIPLGGSAQPVSLASQEPGTGQYGTVSGWGVQGEGMSSQPFQLQSVTIPIVSRWTCNAAYENRVTSRMICAGLPSHDSCQGDSGGPFVVGGVQAGIVSWGYGCARPGYPGVYTNVAQVRGFIDRYSGRQAQWI